MRIREVELLTGLTRKSIRFYEKKGLLSVVRSENTYREYSDADVAQLRIIATLRQVGVSLSDIQLWQDAVISTEEMLNKRLGELMDSTSLAANQVGLCRQLLDGLHDGLLALPQKPADGDSEPIDETEVSVKEDATSYVAGIDIGTTTVSAVVLNPENGEQLGVYTIRNDSFIPSARDWEKMQRPEEILERVRRLLSSLRKRYPAISCVGLSGQMHGILYLDGNGQPLSPLYTWQDMRAGQGNPSACDEIKRITGYRTAPGYGLATAYHHWIHGEIPPDTVSLCTVMDYVGMALCGHTKPLIHTTNAASLGLFRMDTMDFDREALQKLDFPLSVLPAVTQETCLLGEIDGLPVSVAIGDNQASFLGATSSAVGNPSAAVLANFGTGSQVSLMSDCVLDTEGSIETRPYFDGRYLISGSALCGGRAYRLLERFFCSYAAACGQPAKEQYEVLNRLAEQGMSQDNLPCVVPTFCGTRDDKTVRGQILDIAEANFTPEAFTAGLLVGMARELYDMYTRVPHENVLSLVASGNAVRLNPALQKALTRVFGLPVSLPTHAEETACGVALFADKARKRAETVH